MKNSVVSKMIKYVKKARFDWGFMGQLRMRYGRKMATEMIQDNVSIKGLRKLVIHGDNELTNPSNYTRNKIKELKEANRKWVEFGIFW